MTEATIRKVLRQHWLESESGWGTRPDGYSLHTTPSMLRTYVTRYWATMPDSIPLEYSRPCGDPEEIEVSEGEWAEVVAAGGSLRRYR